MSRRPPPPPARRPQPDRSIGHVGRAISPNGGSASGSRKTTWIVVAVLAFGLFMVVIAILIAALIAFSISTDEPSQPSAKDDPAHDEIAIDETPPQEVEEKEKQEDDEEKPGNAGKDENEEEKSKGGEEGGSSGAKEGEQPSRNMDEGDSAGSKKGDGTEQGERSGSRQGGVKGNEGHGSGDQGSKDGSERPPDRDGTGGGGRGSDSKGRDEGGDANGRPSEGERTGPGERSDGVDGNFEGSGHASPRQEGRSDSNGGREEPIDRAGSEEGGSADGEGDDGVAGGTRGIDGPPLRRNRVAAGKGKLFGLEARGNRFVYVVDCSYYLRREQFLQVRNELMQSLHALKDDQQFLIILFSDDAFPMYDPDREVNPVLVAPTDNVLKKVETWLTEFTVWGNPDPAPAVEMALALRPDAVFLLAGGKFDRKAVEAVKQANSKQCVIHAIGLFDEDVGKLLKFIASQNGGEYRFID